MFVRWCVGASLAGCALAFAFPISGFIAYCALLTAVVFWILFRSHIWIRRGCVIMTCVALGVMRVSLSIGDATDSRSIHYGMRNDITGIVRSEPRISGKIQNLIIELSDGTILLQTGVYPRYRVSDQIRFSCVLQPSSGNSGYRAYLGRLGVEAVCRYPSRVGIEKRKESPYSFDRLRDRVGRVISATFPRPSSDLLTGILIGTNPGFSVTLRTAFQRTGLSHIVAVSGANIALVALFLFRFLSILTVPRVTRSTIVIVLLIGYTLLTGASSSAIRACVMGSLTIIAPLVGRVSISMTALLMTAAGMVAVTPSALSDDLSFQLSFMATLGLIAFAPRLEPMLVWIPSRFGLRATACQTLSAIVFTTPLIMMTFHTVSFAALAANILVVPIVPVIMIAGFAWMIGALLLGTIGLVLPALFSWPLWLLLSEPITVANLLAAVPFASISIENERLAFAAGVFLYVALAAWWALLARTDRTPVGR